MEARGLSEWLIVNAIIKLLLACVLARARNKRYPGFALQKLCSSAHAYTDFLLFCLHRDAVAEVGRKITGWTSL
jgi:hypothetical protein